MEKLTLRQRLFVTEYLRCFNGTKAAIRAGYSKRSAYSIAEENLKKPEIVSAVEAGLAELAMSSSEVLARLADIARGDIADLLEITPEGFTFKLLVMDPRGRMIVNPHTRLIKRIKQKATTFPAKTPEGEDRIVIETELELYSALDALTSLAKHHKLFSDSAIDVRVEVGETLLSALDKIYGAALHAEAPESP